MAEHVVPGADVVEAEDYTVRTMPGKLRVAIRNSARSSAILGKPLK